MLAACCGLAAEGDRHGDVAISVRESTVRSGSNVVTFVITNGFEFPIRFGAAAQTREGGQTWRPVYSSGKSIVLLRGEIGPQNTTTFTWTLPPTNLWKIQVSYNDARNLSKNRVQGYVSSPEMVGGLTIQPVK
jgi:hypothetical protein